MNEDLISIADELLSNDPPDPAQEFLRQHGLVAVLEAVGLALRVREARSTGDARLSLYYARNHVYSAADHIRSVAGMDVPDPDAGASE